MNMKKAAGWMVAVVITVAGVQAEEIVVSWQSNGVLQASNMKPGSTCVVEGVSALGETFTNAAGFFDAEYIVDSNGMIQVAIPMFFRVCGMPVSEEPSVPEGMVEIPAGTNSGTDPSFGSYSLTNESAFYMDATEVMKAQWDTVYHWAITNGYSFDHAGSGKATNHPVQMVSWYDCVKWCNARSEKEGRTPAYTLNDEVYRTGSFGSDGSDVVECNFTANGFRLPTVVEWEYAARGGYPSRRFPWGDTITHSQANYWSSSSYSYDISSTRNHHPLYDDGEFPYTSPAGSFSANGYELYDMTGNVWEWCWDWSDSLRGIRGGSWSDYVGNQRCGLAYRAYPDAARSSDGFRAVCR